MDGAVRQGKVLGNEVRNRDTMIGLEFDCMACFVDAIFLSFPFSFGAVLFPSSSFIAYIRIPAIGGRSGSHQCKYLSSKAIISINFHFGPLQ